MKKLISMIMAMAMTSALVVACGDNGTDDETPPPVSAPAIVLENGDIDQPQEITSTMSLKVSVTAPGAIAGFTVTIDSPALTEEILDLAGLAKELDLVNPGSMAESLTAFGFPVSDKVKDKTSVSFDISKLVPMIAQIYHETSDHKFILKVTDAKGQSTTKTLTCHLTEGPAIVLEGGNIDEPQEIASEMSLKVSITAPATITGFTVTIDSPFLTSEELERFGLAAELDLVNPGDMAGALETLEFPVGDKVKDQTSVLFDVSQLVPMIAAYNQTSDHKFVLKVTDANGKISTKTLTCHLTAKTTIAYNNDADLWTNTATVTAKAVPEGGSVQYRVKGAADWIDAELVEGSTYKLVPVWTSAKNGAGIDVYSVQTGTGVFAATTYEVRVVEGGETINTTEFTTAAGDTIPAFTADSGCFTSDNTAATFWGSGNNSIAKKLCTFSSPYAYMQANEIFSILAPGNLFTGTFTFVKQGFAGMTSYGTVGFGQKYTYTARPTALQLSYKITFGSKICTKYTHENELKEGDHDQASIMVCIIDWNARHNVTSGNNGAPTGSWNPESLAGLSEAEKAGLIAYGVVYPDQDVADDTLLTIPLNYYNKDAGIPKGDYTIVISCSTSRYGDYLNGSANAFYVKDFEWVY